MQNQIFVWKVKVFKRMFKKTEFRVLTNFSTRAKIRQRAEIRMVIPLARINKAKLTRIEILRAATRKILELGYSNTSAKAVADELGMSTGNLTFYFPTKEHILAEMVGMLCDFQWKMMEKEADEGYSSLMAICLELTAMAAMCEENAIIKDFYLAAYSSPMALEIIRKNDAARAKTVFADRCSTWTEEQFAEAEILVSGIEYATLMTTDSSVSVEIRIAGALNNILTIYGVPEDIRRAKIDRVLSMDYLEIGRRIFEGFVQYVEETNEHALEELLLLRRTTE